MRLPLDIGSLHSVAPRGYHAAPRDTKSISKKQQYTVDKSRCIEFGTNKCEAMANLMIAKNGNLIIIIVEQENHGLTNDAEYNPKDNIAKFSALEIQLCEDC